VLIKLIVRILKEQSNEFRGDLYLLFIDFEKAFDSIDRDQIWIQLKNYGIPPKIIKLIQESYKDYTCQVIHDGKLTAPTETGTGVKNGCILSPTIFLVMMDSVMRRTTEHKQRGIQWDLTRKLEDLDFTNDICLLAQNFEDMTEQLVDLNREARKVGMKINPAKTKAMRINNKNTNTFTVDGKEIGNDEFLYLGGIVTKEGGSAEDVRNKISK
jgi:hypothetical protein